jgi:hypothetical protein
MRGHSRPKDGVLLHAYDPRIHDERQRLNSYGHTRGAASWIAGSSPAMTIERFVHIVFNVVGLRVAATASHG